MRLEEVGPDEWAVVSIAGTRDRTVAFRLYGTEYADLVPLIESFPQRKASTAMRWLLAHPAVKALIDERVRGLTRSRDSDRSRAG